MTPELEVFSNFILVYRKQMVFVIEQERYDFILEHDMDINVAPGNLSFNVPLKILNHRVYRNDLTYQRGGGSCYYNKW